jgi:hypothetical protein
MIRRLFEKLKLIKPSQPHLPQTNVMRSSIPPRFEKWEDAILYLGKPVRVCLVESPDIKGNLTGILLSMSGDEILTGFLEINGYRWEYWKCRAENYA